ncbi:MAG TPA: alkaline phosphatase family protein, partial [Gemmatimonadaceae bacterium]|nr:alkaline phosphatase family protein [Gemmatimonadaceae bacterium]
MGVAAHPGGALSYGLWRHLRWLLLSCVCVTVLVTIAARRRSHRSRYVVIVVFDGLRPDAITPTDMPTVSRLALEGVQFTSTHAAVPTVTRVNGAALATGTYPGTNGLVDNTVYEPSLDSVAPVSTGDFRVLLRIDSLRRGRLLERATLAERLAAHGTSYAAVSTGSSGDALLVNLRAPEGEGVLVDSGCGDGRVAYPRWLSDSIVRQLGRPPVESDATTLIPLLDWTGRALREVVLPAVRPQVLLYWLTEPDQSQHLFGVGSPRTRMALRDADRNLALLLDALGVRRDSTDVIILSDHGFAHATQQVNVTQALRAEQLMSGAGSDDLVLTDDGESVQFTVRGHDPRRIAAIARWLQRQPWTDLVLTRGGSGRVEGDVAGTVSLDVVHLQHPTRGPDLMVTFRWSADTSAYGVPGTEAISSQGP